MLLGLALWYASKTRFSSAMHCVRMSEPESWSCAKYKEKTGIERPCFGGYAEASRVRHVRLRNRVNGVRKRSCY
jgi:hypothetical protein